MIPASEEEPIQEVETVEPELCLKSSVSLVNLKQIYTFNCVSGQLFLTTLSFTDSAEGACLNEWVFDFTNTEEPDSEALFNQNSQMLTFFTQRTDLDEARAHLKVIRGNNDVFWETEFVFKITVPAALAEADEEAVKAATLDPI